MLLKKTEILTTVLIHYFRTLITYYGVLFSLRGMFFFLLLSQRILNAFHPSAIVCYSTS